MPRQEEVAGGWSWWRNVGGAAPSANGRLRVVTVAALVLAVLAVLQSGPPHRSADAEAASAINMYRMLHQRAPLGGGEPQLRPLWSTPRMRERAAELLLPGQPCQGLSEGEVKRSTQAETAIAIRSRGAAAPSAVVAQLVQSAAEHLLSPSLNEFGVAVKDGCWVFVFDERRSHCGSGLLDAGEECDDGNALDGDGCTAHTCHIEPNYHCHQSFEQPTSVCVAARAGNEGRPAAHGRRAGAREETWSGLAMAGYALGVGIFALSGLTFMVLIGLASLIYFKPHLRTKVFEWMTKSEAKRE